MLNLAPRLLKKYSPYIFLSCALIFLGYHGDTWQYWLASITMIMLIAWKTW